MISSQSVIGKKVFNPSYINVLVRVSHLSTILLVPNTLKALLLSLSLVFNHKRAYKHPDIIVERYLPFCLKVLY